MDPVRATCRSLIASGMMGRLRLLEWIQFLLLLFFAPSLGVKAEAL